MACPELSNWQGRRLDAQSPSLPAPLPRRKWGKAYERCGAAAPQRHKNPPPRSAGRGEGEGFVTSGMTPEELESLEGHPEGTRSLQTSMLWQSSCQATLFSAARPRRTA